MSPPRERLTPDQQAAPDQSGAATAEKPDIAARLADLLITAVDEGGLTFEQLANSELTAADIAELVRSRKRELLLRRLQFSEGETSAG